MTSSDTVMFVVGLALGPVLFLGLLLAVNAALAPKRPTPTKGEPYECGIPQAASPWRAVNVRFSTVALLFVIFDAEAVLLFAVASRVRGSLAGALEVGGFVLLLGVGLLYAWKKGALKWPA